MLLFAKPHSSSVDAFAFGVLLNELWAREVRGMLEHAPRACMHMCISHVYFKCMACVQVPWDGYSPVDIRNKATAGERPPIPRTMPHACESLVRKLWHQTPAQRPTFAEAIPALEAIRDVLPGGGASSIPLPEDSLDALSSLSLKPR